MKKLITIVIPVCNEERNIVPVFQALAQTFSGLPQYAWKVMFVDDGSKDRSVNIVKQLLQEQTNVQFVELSRNFKKEAATSAGLCEAEGDAIILMDADLQHPPELIPEFIKKWEEGFDTVVGVRTRNQQEGFIKRYGSKLFYKIMGTMSQMEFIPGETDFRLVDRKVVDEFKRFTEHNRMTRALLDWLGFYRFDIEFVANPRLEGEASYSIKKLIGLAFDSFISHSYSLLRATIYGGLIGVMFGFTGSLFIAYTKYLSSDPYHFHFSGLALLTFIIIFLVSGILVAIGIAALYVQRIHEEAINRPLYVIRDKKL